MGVKFSHQWAILLSNFPHSAYSGISYFLIIREGILSPSFFSITGRGAEGGGLEFGNRTVSFLQNVNSREGFISMKLCTYRINKKGLKIVCKQDNLVPGRHFDKYKKFESFQNCMSRSHLQLSKHYE